MKLLKRIYLLLQKLFSIKVLQFVVATWALKEGLITGFVWFGSALLLIGGREIAKILAGKGLLK